MTVGGHNAVAAFAALGALSGAIATGLLMAFLENWKIEIGEYLFISPLSIVAGLVFGMIFGAVLRYLDLASAALARGDGGILNWLILFVPWQAGYAAAVATALPAAGAGEG